MEVALFEPRIPQNTGNIARSCAAFDIPLNLIEPLGFKLEDKYLKRAGLDYWPLVTVNKYENFEKFLTSKATNRIISFIFTGLIFIIIPSATYANEISSINKYFGITQQKTVIITKKVSPHLSTTL